MIHSGSIAMEHQTARQMGEAAVTFHNSWRMHLRARKAAVGSWCSFSHGTLEAPKVREIGPAFQ